MLLGTCTPTLKVFASESISQSSDMQSKEDYDTVDDKINDVELMNNIQKYAADIGIKSHDDTIYITDSQMEELFKYMGYDLSSYKVGNNFARANGVTKIVTKKGKGSWDVYLSGTFLRNYYGAAGILGAGLTVAIAALSGGLLLGVAGAMATALANHIKGEIKHGVIVRVRNWGISSIGQQ